LIPFSLDDNFFKYAKELSPAALDLELRSLVTPEGMKALLNALSRRLQSHRDFEAVQAILNVFLKVHADIFLINDNDDDGLTAELKKLIEVQKQESERILELVTSSLGTLGFVRDTM
jgi:U3 small nucleolar RNA-associated protein 21